MMSIPVPAVFSQRPRRLTSSIRRTNPASASGGGHRLRTIHGWMSVAVRARDLDQALPSVSRLLLIDLSFDVDNRVRALEGLSLVDFLGDGGEGVWLVIQDPVAAVMPGAAGEGIAAGVGPEVGAGGLGEVLVDGL